MPVSLRRVGLLVTSVSASVAGLLYYVCGSDNQDAAKDRPKDVPKRQGLMSDVDCFIEGINLEAPDSDAPAYRQSGAFGFRGETFTGKECCRAMGETLQVFMDAQRFGKLQSAVDTMKVEEAQALKRCGSPPGSSGYVFEVSNSEGGSSVGPAVCLVPAHDDREFPGGTVQKLVMAGLSEKACTAFSSSDLQVRTDAIKELPTAFSVQAQLTLSLATSEEATMIDVLRALTEAMGQGAAAWRLITAHAKKLQDSFIM